MARPEGLESPQLRLFISINNLQLILLWMAKSVLDFNAIKSEFRADGGKKRLPKSVLKYLRQAP